MRFAPVAILAATLPLISASLAADAVSWAHSLVSSDDFKAKSGEVHTMDAWSWVDCGLPSDAVQIRSISVSPDPPQPGKNLTVHVEADVLQIVDEGSVADVTVKLGLIKLLQKSFDICEEARGANATVQCPVAPGPYSVTQTVELPKEIPKAKFSVAVRGYTADEADMLCLNLFIDFMKRPGQAQ